jgi:ribose transport system substrate-binding protein
MAPSYVLTNLERAIDVFTRLQAIPGETTSLVELSRQTGVNKATVLRILRTLERHGWVTQPVPGRYSAALLFSTGLERLRRIGYASRDNRLPFPRAVTESITQTAASHHTELLTFDNRGSVSQTVRNAQRILREKVDVAVVFQAASDSGPELASLFHGSGIPLISIDMTIAGASYFGADNYAAGVLAGQAARRMLPAAPIDEVILVGNTHFGSLPAARLSGFLQSFEKRSPRASQLQITRLDSRGSFETGLRLLRTKMRSSKLRRGIIVCVSDPAAMGAMQAIEESGRAHLWQIWSFGGAKDIRRELRRTDSPIAGAIGFGPEDYGNQLWKLVAPMVEKKATVPALFAKMKVLTRDNIESLYPQDLAGDVT